LRSESGPRVLFFSIHYLTSPFFFRLHLSAFLPPSPSLFSPASAGYAVIDLAFIGLFCPQSSPIVPPFCRLVFEVLVRVDLFRASSLLFFSLLINCQESSSPAADSSISGSSSWNGRGSRGVGPVRRGENFDFLFKGFVAFSTEVLSSFGTAKMSVFL